MMPICGSSWSEGVEGVEVLLEFMVMLVLLGAPTAST